ncbi:MAG: family peptidase [Schumannella sp.]|nr:family peptidase [Schumannella sp.]
MRLDTGGLGARLRAWRFGALVVLSVTALVSPLLSAPGPVSASPSIATAASIHYPTWAEVKAARSSEAKAKKQIAAIKALLAKLEADLKAAQADEIAKGNALEAAQNAYDDQVMVADDLRAQADSAGGEADVAKKQANRLLAMLAKSGDGDVVANLLVHAGDADALLYRLEAMNRLSEQSNQIYAQALALSNTAKSLADQADIAEKKRDELKVLAEKALDAARAATVAADKAVQEQQDHQADLQAQLSVLVEKRQATEKDYRAGVIAREKARKAALAAAAAAAGQAGEVNAAGWSRPSSGYISSGFGMRYHPIYHRWILHSGTDIAGQGCGAPIHAAHGGFVSYAGWNGTLGNYVQVNHEDGTSSGYGHIKPGGILVAYGQYVHAGQVIARVGTTGASTGCHLHFIIRVNGQLTNPVPFMRNRGIALG